MIYAVLEWTCTIVALIAFSYRWITVFRSDHNPAQVALTVYFLFSFLSFFVGLDAISGYLAAFFNTPNITIILSHGAVIVLTAAQQVALIYWAQPPETARRTAARRCAVFGLVLVAMIIVFFWVQPTHRDGTSATSSLLNMTNKYFAAYLILFTVAAAVGQVVTLRMAWGYSKVTDRAWLRRSMITLAAGALCILVYSAMRLAEIVGTNLGADMTPWNPIEWLAGDIGSLLEVLGLTAPGWGPVLSAARRWLVNYVRYQRLRPLWEALHRATPDIALEAPRSRLADLVLVRNLDHLLYRRVIEILDGRRSLRPYLEPVGSESAADDYAREAAQVRRALRIKGEGRPPLGEPAPDQTLLPDGSLTNEVKRLAALATAFRRTTTAATVGDEPVEDSGHGSANGDRLTDRS
ncbi:MAB_1171c family putative transporter [Kutzneria chonburiensis]|uniref:MAB_1171c family putative transporter n=1 Tax=Kutzneria chonburiensis TaxID=1483604 RepID=A0ABV6N8K2_9PSEU|nr:MAB_1171c family putative transporter [Kutzneria chonburiensis]